jgi:hypothetical protein
MTDYMGGGGYDGMDWGSVPESNPPTPNANANLGDFNGGGAGGSNPNNQFNPTGGQYDQGTQNFTSGGDSNPNGALTTTSTSANTPQNTEYQTWTWEQIMNTTLGLSLPDRSEITNGRWTGIETGSKTDPGLYLIFQLKYYTSAYKSNTVNVYLAPEFTFESTSGPSESPWLVFQQGPGQLLGTFTATSGSFDMPAGAYGLDTPATSAPLIDPSGFAPAAQALMDAESFYMNAMDNLGFIAQGLAGNANQFQGEAGGEFAQLMQDFSQQATYAAQTMGVPSDLGLPGQSDTSYSGLVLEAGRAAGDYLGGVWNAWANWTQQLAHTPLGAILQAMMDFGIVQGQAGNWSVANVNLLNFNVSGVGNNLNLASDETWLAIEGQAKKDWGIEVVNGLDVPGQKALYGLVSGYYQATDNLGPLQAHTPTQIGGDIGSGGPNGAGNLNLSGLFPNNLFGGLFPNNLFGGLIPNNLFSDVFPNNMFSGAFPNNLFGGLIPNNLFSDVFPNNMFSGLNYPNNMFGGGGGTTGSVGGPGAANSFLTSYNLNPNQYSSGTVNPNPFTTTYSVNPNQYTSGTVNPNPFTTTYSLNPNQYTSGTVNPNPFTSAVVNPNLPTATATLGSGTSGQTALQEALDSNAGTQDALQAALTSGQVTPGSALYSDLNTALNDANKTQAALNQAESAGSITTSALQSAQADNAGTQAALNQALNSGQVTPGSGLQSTLNSALNSANQTQGALNTAVTSASAPSTQATAIRTALGDNSQTQHELTQALQSGGVPASSPLHSTIQSALTDAGKTQAAINQALKSSSGSTTASLDQALKDNQATQKALETALASGQVPTSGPLRNDLNQALADAKQTGTALQQALAQQGVQAEPNLAALSSAVGVPGIAAAGTVAGSAPLLSASLPAPAAGAAAQAAPLSSGAFTAPAAQPAAGSSSENPFPMYSPMAGSGMMGGQGQGQGQGQERERSTWLAEDEDVWGTDPEVGPQVLGRGYTDDEEPEEYDGYTDRPERPARKRPPTRRMPGR